MLVKHYLHAVQDFAKDYVWPIWFVRLFIHRWNDFYEKTVCNSLVSHLNFSWTFTVGSKVSTVTVLLYFSDLASPWHFCLAAVVYTGRSLPFTKEGSCSFLNTHLITARVRSTREGNVLTSVCPSIHPSVCPQGGGWVRYPPPGGVWVPPWGGPGTPGGGGGGPDTPGGVRNPLGGVRVPPWGCQVPPWGGQGSR